jgi:putative hemolysin
MSGSAILTAAGASGVAAAIAFAPALEDLANGAEEPPSTVFLLAGAVGLLVAGYGALLGSALQVYSPTKIARRVSDPQRGRDLLRELTAHDATDQALARVLQVGGLTFASWAVWIGTPVSGRALSIAITLLAATILTGALPARVGERRAEDVLMSSLGALRRLRWILAVLTWPVHVATIAAMRLLHIPDNEPKDRETVAEEILAAVGDSTDEGGIEEERRDWIEAIVQMKEKSASEIKTPRTDIVAFDENQPLIEALRGAVKSGFSRYPVYRNTLDDVVGVFYVKDALGLLGHGKKDEFRTVGELMRQPLFAPESRSIVDLLREFRMQKVQLAVLLDEYGGTAGIVSIEDILEEIFGDIVDEHDPDEDEEIRVIEAGRVIEVSGRARVDDINDEIETPVPVGEDYDTLAGFIISRLDRIPKPGETVKTDGLEFEILAADDRRIGRVRLRVQQPAEAEQAAETANQRG